MQKPVIEVNFHCLEINEACNTFCAPLFRGDGLIIKKINAQTGLEMCQLSRNGDHKICYANDVVFSPLELLNIILRQLSSLYMVICTRNVCSLLNSMKHRN